MRRPARLERAGALTPRDRIWAAIRCFGQFGLPGAHREFSVAEIMVLSEQRADTALAYLRGLEKAGFIKPIEGERLVPGRREFRRYRLVRDIGVDAPRVTGDGTPVEQGAGREQMWRAVKVLKDFDCRELAAAASTEPHPVSVEEVKTYARLLARAGYLQLTVRGGSHRAARYRFLRARNTGPREPLVSRAKEVIDSNTGQVMFSPTAAS